MVSYQFTGVTIRASRGRDSGLRIILSLKKGRICQKRIDGPLLGMVIRYPKRLVQIVLYHIMSYSRSRKGTVNNLIIRKVQWCFLPVILLWFLILKL